MGSRAAARTTATGFQLAPHDSVADPRHRLALVESSIQVRWCGAEHLLQPAGEAAHGLAQALQSRVGSSGRLRLHGGGHRGRRTGDDRRGNRLVPARPTQRIRALLHRQWIPSRSATNTPVLLRAGCMACNSETHRQPRTALRKLCPADCSQSGRGWELRS